MRSISDSPSQYSIIVFRVRHIIVVEHVRWLSIPVRDGSGFHGAEGLEGGYCFTWKGKGYLGWYYLDEKQNLGQGRFE